MTSSRPSDTERWILLGLGLGISGLAIWVARHLYRQHALERKTGAPSAVTIPVPPPPVEAPPVEKPAPPPVRRAQWEEHEPTDPADPVKHLEHRLVPGEDQWRLAGASRRGKMHAHQGTYREDAMDMAVVDSWHIAAVADGAGSCSFSRVGSGLATRAAVAEMKALLQAEAAPSQEWLSEALRKSLQAAHAALQREAEERGRPLKDFSATFLLLVHGLIDGQHVVGSIQVGDGLLALQMEDETIVPLAERDSGAFGGETSFLTSRPAEHWVERSTVRALDGPPAFLVAMTDGVADDFIPYEQNLPRMFAVLRKLVNHEESYSKGDVDQLLLRLIGYEARGSFDDRTLVVIYQELAP